MSKTLNEMKSVSDDVNLEPSADASGIYTWVLATDTVYSDSLVADTFGFSRSEARRGLALGEYLARIHPDDLPRVAKAIHDTVASGLPFSEQYRVCRPDGTMVEITALGSCFRDAANEPLHYCGILFPIDACHGREATILGNLLAAYDIANREGRSNLAQKIVSALAEVSGQEADLDVAERAGHLH